MKYRNAFLFFLAGFLLQSTLVLNFSVAGVTPNFILCLTVLFSFLYQGNQGLTYGVIFGILQDVGGSVLVGPSAMLYFLIALLMSEIRHYLYRDSILNLFFAAAIGTGLYYPTLWLILMVFRGNYGFLYMLKDIPILLALHFAFMVIFYLTIGKLSIRHPQDRNYRSRKLYID